MAGWMKRLDLKKKILELNYFKKAIKKNFAFVCIDDHFNGKLMAVTKRSTGERDN